MFITEVDAKTKRCCVEALVRSMPSQNLCLASGCMGWRWDTETHYPRDAQHMRLGYCGRAGVVSHG